MYIRNKADTCLHTQAQAQAHTHTHNGAKRHCLKDTTGVYACRKNIPY